MMKINITKRLNRFLAVAGAMLIGALPALAQESSLTRVAANDCGVPGAQPFLVKGENYTMPSEVKGSKEAITCNFGGKVIYALISWIFMPTISWKWFIWLTMNVNNALS